MGCMVCVWCVSGLWGMYGACVVCMECVCSVCGVGAVSLLCRCGVDEVSVGCRCGVIVLCRCGAIVVSLSLWCRVVGAVPVRVCGPRAVAGPPLVARTRTHGVPPHPHSPSPASHAPHPSWSEPPPAPPSFPPPPLLFFPVSLFCFTRVVPPPEAFRLPQVLREQHHLPERARRRLFPLSLLPAPLCPLCPRPVPPQTQDWSHRAGLGAPARCSACHPL